MLKANEMTQHRYGIVAVRKAKVVDMVADTYGRRSDQGGWNYHAGYRQVRDETGEVHSLINGSMHCTTAQIGDEGVLQYITSPRSGLWYFKKDTEEEP